MGTYPTISLSSCCFASASFLEVAYEDGRDVDPSIDRTSDVFESPSPEQQNSS